ncbi:TetR/AcrR family transcriptional regulator [Ekhidna sp.]|uniref:TetR/AcrR family transcriptional regulator n=1 Tax=Ekhidna sp. TaxID=2608089 RepID=UPI003517B2BB
MKKLRILATIRKLILEEGFENASLDRVSVELGISKKTIYKYYDSKSDILTILLKRFIVKHIKYYETKIDYLDPTQRIIQLFYMCNEIYMLIDDKVLRFIAIYIPDGKDELSTFENNFIVSSFEKAISEGVSLQCFRREVDARILAIMALQLAKLRCRIPELKKSNKDLPQIIDHFIAGLKNHHEEMKI